MSQEVGLVAEQAAPVTSRSGISVRTDAAERSSSTAVSLGGDAAVFDFDILSPACPSTIDPAGGTVSKSVPQRR